MADSAAADVPWRRPLRASASLGAVAIGHAAAVPLPPPPRRRPTGPPRMFVSGRAALEAARAALSALGPSRSDSDLRPRAERREYERAASREAAGRRVADEQPVAPAASSVRADTEASAAARRAEDGAAGAHDEPLLLADLEVGGGRVAAPAAPAAAAGTWSDDEGDEFDDDDIDGRGKDGAGTAAHAALVQPARHDSVTLAASAATADAVAAGASAAARSLPGSAASRSGSVGTASYVLRRGGGGAVVRKMQWQQSSPPRTALRRELADAARTRGLGSSAASGGLPRWTCGLCLRAARVCTNACTHVYMSAACACMCARK